MNRLELILSAVMTLSLLLNIGLFIYARAAIVRLLSVSEELSDLQRMVDSFARHLKTVYELDSFYGDETLHGLLEHAISFNEQMDTFDYIISLTEEAQEENTEEPPHDNQDNTTQEETPDVKIIILLPDHEEAIVRYAKSTCQRERTELYIQYIQPAFNEMVDKIVFVRTNLLIYPIVTR